MIKPQGKLTVYRDDVFQHNKMSHHEPSDSRKGPASLFELHERPPEDSPETVRLLFAHIKNLSTSMKELSERVQESIRFFNSGAMSKKPSADNEQALNNIFQAQTTLMIDQVIAEVSQKVGERLSVHLTQMVNQEKKSSELLLNALNHRFQSLDQRCDTLDRSLFTYVQRVDMKARSSFGLKGSGTQATSHNQGRDLPSTSSRTGKGQAVIAHKSHKLWHRIADSIVTSGLTLLSNPSIILLLLVLCLAGWRISVIFQRKVIPYPLQTTMEISEKSSTPLEQKENLELAHISQDTLGITPSTVIKDMATLGDFLPKNRELSSLKAAVLSGDSLAIYEMGLRFLSGTGVKREPGLAIRFFEKAAGYNSPFAAYQLASQYEKGTGVARDVQKSIVLYEKAANAGHVKAMHNLGALIAAGGLQGKPDYEKAIGWFRKAADHGLKDSQYNLGLLLAHGLGGPQDHVEAYKWFDLAGQQNDDESLKKRDMVAKKMSSTDLALARVRTSQWRAQASTLIESHEASVLLPWTKKSNLPVRGEAR